MIRQARTISQRGSERSLHSHAARKMAKLAIERKIELPDQLRARDVVPSRVKGFQIREQIPHRHPFGQLLVFGNIADFAKRVRAELCANRRPALRRGRTLGRRMFIRILMVVVLPAPLGPASPNTLPSGTMRFKPSRTGTWRKRLTRSVAADHVAHSFLLEAAIAAAS